jgi:hypothetical protein
VKASVSALSSAPLDRNQPARPSSPWGRALTHVRERTMAWFQRLHPLGGLPQAHIEPAGNGYSIIETCRAQGFAPHEIDTQLGGTTPRPVPMDHSRSLTLRMRAVW